MQSSEGQEQGQGQENEQDDLGQGDVMPGLFEPVHQEPVLAWKKTLDGFLTLFYFCHAFKLMRIE